MCGNNKWITVRPGTERLYHLLRAHTHIHQLIPDPRSQKTGPIIVLQLQLQLHVCVCVCVRACACLNRKLFFFTRSPFTHVIYHAFLMFYFN